MAWLYFKSEDDGDGTYDGQIGHAYLHLDDDASEKEEQDLGFITVSKAAEIARANGAEIDIDGPTREEMGRTGGSGAAFIPEPRVSGVTPRSRDGRYFAKPS